MFGKSIQRPARQRVMFESLLRVLSPPPPGVFSDPMAEFEMCYPWAGPVSSLEVNSGEQSWRSTQTVAGSPAGGQLRRPPRSTSRRASGRQLRQCNPAPAARERTQTDGDHSVARSASVCVSWAGLLLAGATQPLLRCRPGQSFRTATSGFAATSRSDTESPPMPSSVRPNLISFGMRSKT